MHWETLRAVVLEWPIALERAVGMALGWPGALEHAVGMALGLSVALGTSAGTSYGMASCIGSLMLILLAGRPWDCQLHCDSA